MTFKRCSAIKPETLRLQLLRMRDYYLETISQASDEIRKIDIILKDSENTNVK